MASCSMMSRSSRSMFASPLDDDARGPGATWSRVPSFRSEATESVAPWWSLHSGTAAHLDEHPAPPAALSTSLQPGGRWAVDAAPPPWFKAAFHMQQNRTLEAEEAFAITELMAGGDAEDLEELLKIEVRPDPAGGQSTASFAVEADPLADLARVEPGARVYWSPAHDNLRGVASHHVDGDQGANEWYRLAPTRVRRNSAESFEFPSIRAGAARARGPPTAPPPRSRGPASTPTRTTSRTPSPSASATTTCPRRGGGSAAATSPRATASGRARSRPRSPTSTACTSSSTRWTPPTPSWSSSPRESDPPGRAPSGPRPAPLMTNVRRALRVRDARAIHRAAGGGAMGAARRAPARRAERCGKGSCKRIARGSEIHALL